MAKSVQGSGLAVPAICVGGFCIVMKSELSRLYPYSLVSRFAADACMAIAVIAVGVAGLTANCWLRRNTEPWVGIHLLFAVLLGREAHLSCSSASQANSGHAYE